MPTAAWVNIAPGKDEPDWIALAREYTSCKRTLILHVNSWQGYTASQSLQWKYVPYKSGQNPDDKRGVYAFVLNACKHTTSPIPPFSTVLYVGETGNSGNATLKSRLASYRNKKSQRERARVYNMLEQWEDSLLFYYATVNAGVSTKRCEKELLNALLPPGNDKDFSAKVSNARNAALDS